MRGSLIPTVLVLLAIALGGCGGGGEATTGLSKDQMLDTIEANFPQVVELACRAWSGNLEEIVRTNFIARFGRNMPTRPPGYLTNEEIFDGIKARC